MAHLPVILIVLTLTGEPVANALCINWCDSPSERQHCGDAIAHTQPLLLAGTSCAALLTPGAFVQEEGQRLSITAARDTVPAFASHPTVGQTLHVGPSVELTAGRLVPPLVLRV